MKIPNISAAPDFLSIRLKFGDIKYFDYNRVSHFAPDAPKLMVYEHPGFKSNRDLIDGLRYKDWSYRNLQKKDYPVTPPFAEADDKRVSLFFILSSKAEKTFLRKFSGAANKYKDYDYIELAPSVKKINLLKRISDKIINKIEALKTKRDKKLSASVVDTFAKSVPDELKDVFFQDEITYLGASVDSAKSQERFFNYLNKLNGLFVDVEVEVKRREL